MSEQTVKDYRHYVDEDGFGAKLLPLRKAVEDMQARLEEFETVLTFVQDDAKESRNILTIVASYKPEFDELCSKIDTIERLVSHVRNNLAGLEAEIEKKEAIMGDAATGSKVTGIFTPFFKKAIERKHGACVQPFKSDDYFK